MTGTKFEVLELSDKSDSNKTLKVMVGALDNGSLVLSPEGMGLYGSGYPIVLELNEGTIRLLVWADSNPNQISPTNIINFTGSFGK
jgi:hypothetical protein